MISFQINIVPNLADKIRTTDRQFNDLYIKNANSEFTAFKPVTIN